MALITFFFFAHQPYRLTPYEHRLDLRALRPDQLHDFYFDKPLNKSIFAKVAENCYFPATRMMLDLVKKHQRDEKPFRVSYGLSGTFLEQAQAFEPELISLFKELAATGCVEFTCETYYHSLSSLMVSESDEFAIQALKHADEIERLFGQRPTLFRNTEMMFNNSIAEATQKLGFEGILTEGVDRLMANWRSTDFIYSAPCGLPVMLRNYQLSDDVGYRFPNKNWEHYPLTSEKLAGWLAGNTDMSILLAMDYEALGEHIWADKGIFDFFWNLPDAIKRFPQLSFSTPTEAVRTLPRVGEFSVDNMATISWADKERDTSAWLGNDMQRFCFEELKRVGELVKASGDSSLLEVWRKMQTSDHLYYMSNKAMSDGDVHQYFSAYGTPLESFVRLQTAILDLKHRVAVS